MNRENIPYIIAILCVPIGFYLIFAGGVGLVNVTNEANWCEYKGGDVMDGKPTGKRWSGNPLTAGLTGECINPGDKGL